MRDDIPPAALAKALSRALLALRITLGQFRTVVYGAARQFLDPWGDPINHLFTAALPVWGAFLALFLLRCWDCGLLQRECDELS